jgi:hypothetical protein
VIPFVAILVALACAVASGRRVWLAANATALHPDVIADAIGVAPDAGVIDRLRALVATVPDADWERDLLEALAAPPALRVALVNEQMTELDYRIQRWARVPRVCASITTSAGFMLGTLVLRNGLALDTTELTSDVVELVIRGLVADALFVASMGIIGMAFCIGAQSEARRIAKARTKGADRLVERLESLLEASSAPETA